VLKCFSQLDYNVTAEKLEEIFRIAGNVLNVELMMDRDTSKFRGMATVRFEHPIESVQAICILHLVATCLITLSGVSGLSLSRARVTGFCQSVVCVACIVAKWYI